jgi:hypothetical protein
VEVIDFKSYAASSDEEKLAVGIYRVGLHAKRLSGAQRYFEAFWGFWRVTFLTKKDENKIKKKNCTISLTLRCFRGH